MDKICIICNKKYKIKPSDFDESKYCSKRCWAVGNKIRCNTIEEKKKRSLRTKLYIKNNGHRKGMKGKRHTKQTKEAISKIVKKRWADPSDKLNSEENKQRTSDHFSKLWNPHKESSYSRGLGGRRKDLDDQYFRSRWEANFARYLNFLKKNKSIYRWEYESDTFWFEKIKRGTRSYTPDFKIWDEKGGNFYYYEVKGWMDEKSKVKLKRMDKYYPNIKIILIGEKEYKAIKKDIKSFITEWE